MSYKKTYTVKQFAVLRYLYNLAEGSATTQQILDTLKESGFTLDGPNLSAGANRLASFGLINRAYKKGKRGKVCVYSITAAGRNEVEAFIEVGMVPAQETAQ